MIVYRIIDNENDMTIGSYERSYQDKIDFSSVEEARNANVNGLFKDKTKYRIAKYKVTYELIEDNCDDKS